MCFNGKNGVVIGAKKSGIAAAKLLRKKGYTPFVTEINDSDEIKENVKELEQLNIDYETGGIMFYESFGKRKKPVFPLVSDAGCKNKFITT